MSQVSRWLPAYIASAVKQNVSYMSVDPETDKVVGVSVNIIKSKDSNCVPMIEYLDPETEPIMVQISKFLGHLSQGKLMKESKLCESIPHSCISSSLSSTQNYHYSDPDWTSSKNNYISNSTLWRTRNEIIITSATLPSYVGTYSSATLVVPAQLLSRPA